MSYDLMFQQAIKLHEQGNLDDAERIYRQILETAPTNPDILNLLGLIAQSKGIHIEAVNFFYQAIKYAPNHAPFHFNLAVSLDAWGKPFEAIDAYNKALAVNPNISEAYNGIGNIYLRLNNKEKAIDNYKKAMEIDENSDAKANIAYILRDYETLKNINKALSYCYLSILYQEDGELDKALESACKSRELDVNVDIIYNQLAEIYIMKNNILQAKEHLKQALVINPYSIPALINMANIETNEKEYDKAEKKYKLVLELSPNDINAHINYANLLYQMKRIHESLEEYRRAVILNPDIPEISNNIGIIQKDFGELELALDLFMNAFTKNPDKEEFSINISETLSLFAQSGKKENALKIAEKWLDIAPKNVFAKHSVMSLSGKEDGSIHEYNQKLFDHFADNYEKVLEKIEYNLPLKIRELTGDIEGKTLDLGCGTGLLGQAIKNNKNTVTGVDLSANMLEIAGEKNIYSELVQDDILSYLKKNNNYDWIAAADVFGYIGKLDEIISFCQNRKLCFSIELLEGEKDYEISETGRYKHSEEYIDTLLSQNGFKSVEKHIVDLRLENNIPVKGIIYIAK